MRTAREIYAAYKIMPNLQLHQLRVAAVGKLVCDNFSEPVDTDTVVLVCLFHDMGNIVKFDLIHSLMPLTPEETDYWKGVQMDVVKKYGSDQHEVSGAIAREIGLPEHIIEMIERSGFRDMPVIIESDSVEWKLVKYSDLRVAPTGIVALEERFEDFARRYRGKTSDLESLGHGKTLEAQLFSHVDIEPADITDATVAPLIEELWEYPVP